MQLGRFLRPVVAVALVLGCAHGAFAQRSLAALRGIETGLWQLKDSEGATRRVCVTDPARLLQIQHGAAQCSYFVVENTPAKATINYSCPGHGSGRTTLSVETRRLIGIETQGVLDGSPFSEEFEGRRVSACN